MIAPFIPQPARVRSHEAWSTHQILRNYIFYVASRADCLAPDCEVSPREGLRHSTASAARTTKG